MVDGYSTNYRRQSDINTSLYNPSFSSTLLDTIYRSIDQGGEEEKLGMRTKQSIAYGSDGGAGVFRSEEEMANFQRACMIEKWMEKKAGEKVAVRGNSAADLGMKKPRKDRENSTSSSSDSSCGGGDFFSSSEAESFPVQRPKPIRTGLEKEKLEKNHRDSESEFHRRERRGFAGDVEQKPKHEGGFLKTKSRALKIYGDLKKVKQPISPGGKLAGFLNSIFAGGNLKKPKTAANGDYSPSLKSANASTCSSASSFSRSCLSKTPSSSGGSKPSNGAKRSVRFSPVSVIVDDKVNNNNNYTKKQTSKFTATAANNNNNKNNINSLRNVINEELMVHVMDKNRRVEDAARDLLRNYHRKNQVGCEFDSSFDHLRKPQVIKNNQIINQNNFDEEDDDAASCASSDLFELDNLSAIGMERYRQELPVYETTHL
ncbi:hypothetical protein ABFS82_09G121700 [Erythranthe guttata]|uniref:uncharacterized protein LOC105975733 n=1 Tax=Erythranthe guttata TaxID=4155 RepID=UPI00064D9D9F|nr:PREDICTED: uncharacterized protein LOC105975733 [Erythranthe guttata]|eukprot:XP_012856404.1 PREDICTED: uncharacterized protein LOC105975733 [Erythranthe guttata]